MSRTDFIDVEWFGRTEKIGIVLTYNEYDGFKCRMKPVSGVSEKIDIKDLMDNAAKIPFRWAWGVWGSRMKAEWMNRHLSDNDFSVLRYDGRDYDKKTLEEVKQ